MNDTRSPAKPLVLGAIKANIGHSEAASGIFAVMKAAMMTEKGIIPGVCGLRKVTPAIHESEWNVHIQRETAPWPAGFQSRRAGVSSFGYGGSNGHVIVEDVTALYPWYQHGLPIAEAAYDHSSTRPYLVGFSAHDKTTLTRNVAAHAEVAHNYYASDLAHTLNFKRSRFSHRGFVIAKDGQSVEDFVASSIGASPKVAPKVGFIFTGQGAQWATMGVDAMKVFPSFLSTIRSLDKVLQSSKADLSWTLEESLLADAGKSRVGEAEISQPVCTAVQIAIVDLLAEWNIIPSVTVGHSSGEIAAAYAAGLISAPEAILAAFYRGYAVHNHTTEGSMLAVGLGADDIVSNYPNVLSNDLVIACVNSPSSVTLSGTSQAVRDAKEVFDAGKIFARELRTGKAYHSPQMAPVAAVYNSLLSEALDSLSENDLRWCRPRSRMISSVHGTELLGGHVSSEYWSQNLRSRVLFDTAVVNMATMPDLMDVTCMVEIGPHSALAGPFKQICQTYNFDRFKYIPTMIRNQNSAEELLKTAGELFIQNYSLDLAAVNKDEPVISNGSYQKSRAPLPLVDLPPYQWNYDKTYSAECKASSEQRQNKHLRHDILGTRVYNISDKAPIWSNFLRQRDLPWLAHHKLGGETIFPAAAHIACAVEAVRQLNEDSGQGFFGATIRDMAITDALNIPESNDGIQIQVRLSQCSTSAGSTWYIFFVESFADGAWTIHTEGKVSAHTQPVSIDASSPVDVSTLTQRVPGKRWYNTFAKIGLEYGPSFNGLRSIRSNGKQHHAAGDIRVTDSELMVGESRYLVHPGTLDSAIQLMLVSIFKGLQKEMHCGQIPVNMEEITIGMPSSFTPYTGNAVAWCSEISGRYTTTHMKLAADDGRVIVDLKGVRCVAYEAGIPQTTAVSLPRQPYVGAVWKPEIFSFTSEAAAQMYSDMSTGAEALGKSIELLNHKAQLSKVLLLGKPPAAMLKHIKENLSSSVELTLVEAAEINEANTQNVKSSSQTVTTSTTLDSQHGNNEEDKLDEGGVQRLYMRDGSSDLQSLDIKAQDLVVVDMLAYDTVEGELLKSIKSVTSSAGSVIFIAETDKAETLIRNLASYGLSGAELYFTMSDSTIIVTRTSPYMNGVVHEELTILYGSDPSRVLELPEALLENGYHSCIKQLANFDPLQDAKIIIYDVEGSILGNTDEKMFSALQKILTSRSSILWLTSGANEGKKTSCAMAKGFLRAIRSERASAKITLLDVDVAENMNKVGEVVAKKIELISTKDSGRDSEFWLHQGIVHVQRLEPNEELNRQLNAGDQPAARGQMQDGEKYDGKIIDNEIVFEKKTNTAELADDEVDVQVSALEFDKSDFQVMRSNHGPRIVTGKVVKAGRQVPQKLIGKKVVTYTKDFLSSRVRVPASLCAPLVAGTGAAEIVATLPSLCEAVNAVSNFARANERGRQSVVLVSAPASAIRSFSGLSLALGFNLAVVHEAEKQVEDDAIKAGQESNAVVKAVDVNGLLALTTEHTASRPLTVVTYDFSTTSQEVWRHMPAGSKFVVNEGAVEVSPAMLPFQRGASFGATSISSLFKQDNALLGQLLQCTMDIFEKHEQQLVQRPYSCDVGSLRAVEVADSVNVATYGPKSEILVSTLTHQVHPG